MGTTTPTPMPTVPHAALVSPGPSTMDLDSPQGEPETDPPPQPPWVGTLGPGGAPTHDLQSTGVLGGVSSSAQEVLEAGGGLAAPPTPALSNPMTLPEPMQEVEFAILLPEKGSEGVLVELARFEAQEMRDGMSRRQVDAAIAYMIRYEPMTWQQGLAIGLSSSCPQVVSRALRRHLEDIFPDMRAVEGEADMGPTPEDAYPPVSPEGNVGTTQPSPAPRTPALPGTGTGLGTGTGTGPRGCCDASPAPPELPGAPPAIGPAAR